MSYPHVYIGLVHYPVYNKRKEIIIAAVTMMNLHDLARLAKTYELGGFFVINPLEDQQELVRRFLDHWLKGYGGIYNPRRQLPLRLVHIVSSLEEAISDIGSKWGKYPKLLGTTARMYENILDYREACALISQRETPFFILFGTAWGLADGLLNRLDYILKPIMGVGGYNHLSVRTAAAIVLDRIFGGEDGTHSNDRKGEDEA